MSVPHDERLNGGNPMSITAWVNLPPGVDQGPWPPIINKGGPSWRLEISMSKDPGDFAFTIDDHAKLRAVRSREDAEHLDGQWHHLAGVLDDKSMTIYVDGLEEGRSGWADPVVVNHNTDEFRMGTRVDYPVRRVIGIIDDVRVYDRALTAEEIKLLATSAGASSPSLPDGLSILEDGWELAHVYRNAEGIEGIAFHPKHGKLYTGGCDRGICRFEDDESVKAIDRAASSPAFAADGESIYCVDYGKTTLTQVDCDSAAAIRTIDSRDGMSFIFRLAPSPSRFKGQEARAGDLLVSEAGPKLAGALRRLTTDGEMPVTVFEFSDGDYVYDFCFGSHRIYLIRAYLPTPEGFDATRLKQTLCHLDDGQLVRISTDKPLDNLGAIVFDHVTSDLLVACWETNGILRVRLDEQGRSGQVSTVFKGFERVAGGGMALSSNGQHLAIHDLGSHTIYVFSRPRITPKR